MEFIAFEQGATLLLEKKKIRLGWQIETPKIEWTETTEMKGTLIWIQTKFMVRHNIEKQKYVQTKPKWKHEIKALRPHRNKMRSHFPSTCPFSLSLTHRLIFECLFVCQHRNAQTMYDDFKAMSLKCDSHLNAIGQCMWFNSHIAANHNLIFSTKQYRPRRKKPDSHRHFLY